MVIIPKGHRISPLSNYNYVDLRQPLPLTKLDLHVLGHSSEVGGGGAALSDALQRPPSAPELETALHSTKDEEERAMTETKPALWSPRSGPMFR